MPLPALEPVLINDALAIGKSKINVNTELIRLFVNDLEISVGELEVSISGAAPISHTHVLEDIEDVVILTESAYEALTPDETTLYFIEED